MLIKCALLCTQLYSPPKHSLDHLFIPNSSTSTLGFPKGIHSFLLIPLKWRPLIFSSPASYMSNGRQSWHSHRLLVPLPGHYSLLFCKNCFFGVHAACLNRSSSLLSSADLILITPPHLVKTLISGSLSSSPLPSFAIIFFDFSICVNYPLSSLPIQFPDFIVSSDVYTLSAINSHATSGI